MNRAVQWTLVICAGIFFYFLFFMIFFPLDGVVHHLLGQFETSTKGVYRITVKEMDLNIFFKSVFRDVEIHQVKDGKDVVLVKLPEVKLGVRYLPLLANDIKTSFKAKAGQGHLEGEISITETEYAVDVDFRQFDLSSFPYIAQTLHMPLQGKLTGIVDLALYPDRITRSEGRVSLKLVNFFIPNNRFSPASGIEIDLPDIEMTDSKGGDFQFKLGQGKLELESFKLTGQDIVVDVKGNFQLNRRLLYSKIGLEGIFRLSDKIKNAIPFLNAIERHKLEDGSFPLNVSGRLPKPDIRIGDFELSSLLKSDP